MAAQYQHHLLNAGDRAPGFRLPRLEGGEASLADLIANGPVLLSFYKVTCPVCQLTLPFLERIHATGTLAIYAISQNDPEDTREFNVEYKITLPTLLDAEESGFPTSNAYGISYVPTMFLVGVDGKISRVVEGWNKQEIEALGREGGVAVFRATDNVPAWKSG
jgi:peroxiredoxin